MKENNGFWLFVTVFAAFAIVMTPRTDAPAALPEPEPGSGGVLPEYPSSAAALELEWWREFQGMAPWEE